MRPRRSRTRFFSGSLVSLAALAVVVALLATSASSSADPQPSADAVSRAVTRARDEVTRRVSYDATYRTLTYKDGVDTGHFAYPAGDVDPAHGVCTDVVVRAYRAGGLDLQVRVHQDVLARPKDYATYVRAPDANIDHRRVGPLMTYFERHATNLPRTTTTDGERASFHAGDVVVWTFSGEPRGYPNHIGLVSDRIGPRGLPLVIHNMGPEPTEDDLLDAWMLIGHYRALK